MDIYLNNKEPVTLQTANKYCKEDINVKIEAEKLNVIPSEETQNFEGLYDEINIDKIPEEYIIPEGTIDITENGEVDVKNYDSAKVNIKATVTSVQSKGVDFIDYDGRILYSYTVEEAQALTELPELPTRKGLICQGWNWSLEDIKELGRDVIVGAMYITDDGKTRLYIEISNDGRMDVPIMFQQTVANGVEIDWGDGSSIQTVASTSARVTHSYSHVGNYVISLNPLGNCELKLGLANSSYTIMGNQSYNNRAYQSMLKSVEFGKNVKTINPYAFTYCFSLSSLSIPNTVTTIGKYAFDRCYSLFSLVVPNGVTKMDEYTFQLCFSLDSISIPNSVTQILSNCFASCYSLYKIHLPNKINTIGTQAFNSCFSLSGVYLPDSLSTIPYTCFHSDESMSKVVFSNSINKIQSESLRNCYSMSVYDFSKAITIPTLESWTAITTRTDTKIIVPDVLYDSWIAATNWTSLAEFIVKASEVV